MTGIFLSDHIGLNLDDGHSRDGGFELCCLGRQDELHNRLRLRSKRGKLAPSISQSTLHTLASCTVHLFILRRGHQQALWEPLRSAFNDGVVKIRHRVAMTGNSSRGFLFQPANFALRLSKRLECGPACVNYGGFCGIEQREKLAVDLVNG